MKIRPSTIGFWLLVFYVLFLFGLREAFSQPAQRADIRILHGSEMLSGHPGLTGSIPCTSADGAATIYAWDGALMPLAVNVELVNVGMAAWCPGNTPGTVAWDYWYGPSVLRAVRLALINVSGTVVAERTCDLVMYDWDGWSVCSGPFCTFGWCWPGLSPAHGGSPWFPFWCGTWLDVAGVLPGDYELLVEFDPLNQWGLKRSLQAPCSIDTFDFWWR